MYYRVRAAVRKLRLAVETHRNSTTLVVCLLFQPIRAYIRIIYTGSQCNCPPWNQASAVPSSSIYWLGSRQRMHDPIITVVALRHSPCCGFCRKENTRFGCSPGIMRRIPRIVFPAHRTISSPPPYRYSPGRRQSQERQRRQRSDLKAAQGGTSGKSNLCLLCGHRCWRRRN